MNKAIFFHFINYCDWGNLVIVIGARHSMFVYSLFKIQNYIFFYLMISFLTVILLFIEN